MEVVHTVEGVEELLENLLLGLSASLNVRMVLAVIDTNEVVDGDIARHVLVEFVEGLRDEILSEVVHLTTDSVDKLVEVDLTITSAVKVAEQLADLIISEPSTKVPHCILELFRIELPVPIVISNLT